MSEDAFSLRKATEDDLSELIRIESVTQATGWKKDHFKTEFQKPYSETLVYTDDATDTKLACYIVYWVMFKECQILNLAVDLPYRGLGFGRRLVKKVVSNAVNKGITKILLEVRKSNVAAIQLYQKCGFVITHVRKGFYSNGEDAYEMALYLDRDSVNSFVAGQKR